MGDMRVNGENMKDAAHALGIYIGDYWNCI